MTFDTGTNAQRIKKAVVRQPERDSHTLSVISGEEIPASRQTEMMERQGFSRDQLKKLVRDVAARHVQTREFDGKRLTYIEGWYAIAQANAIFGHAGWDREMVHFERVIERTRSDSIITCGYMARVRIRVRAGSIEIIREGTGWGSAAASTATAANERALKAAETDATKRALSTFGASFGLSLYDKDHVATKPRPVFTLFSPDGRALADSLSAEAYSTGLRQLIELCKDTHQVDQLSRHNRASLADIRIQIPTLRNTQDVHFADLLLRLMQRQRERVDVAEPERSRNSELSFSVATGRSESDSNVPSANEPENRPAGEPTNVGGPSISFGPGETFYQYAGQSPHRRPPCPFPHRSEVLHSKSEPARSSPVQTKHAGPNKTEAATVDSPGPMATLPSPPSPESEAEIPPAGYLKEHLAAIQGVSDSIPTPSSSISFGLKIDKSKLLLGLERRIRDKAHLRRVAQLPCLICNRQPSHAHHIRFAQRRGLSQKVSDEYVVPLCALHHGELHQSVSEKDWWSRQKIDPLPISLELWAGRH